MPFELSNTSSVGLLAVSAARTSSLKKEDRLHALASACLVYAETEEGTRDYVGRHPADPANFHVRMINPAPARGPVAPRGTAGSWTNVLPTNGFLPLEEYEWGSQRDIYGLKKIQRKVSVEFQEYPRDSMVANFNYGGSVPRGVDMLEVALTKHPAGKVRKFPVGGPMAIDMNTTTAGRFNRMIFRVTRTPTVTKDIFFGEDDAANLEDQRGGLDYRRYAPMSSHLRIAPLPVDGGGRTTVPIKDEAIPCVAAMNFTSCPGSPYGGFHAGFGAFTSVAAGDPSSGGGSSTDGVSAAIDSATDLAGSGVDSLTSRVANPSNGKASTKILTGTVRDDWQTGPWIERGKPVQINAFLSHLAGGPITAGHADSIHRIGESKDGEFWNAGGIDIRALYTNPAGDRLQDGPLDFEEVEEVDIIPRGGIPQRVHLQWDSDVSHTFLTGGGLGGKALRERRIGRWRWHTRVPYLDHGGSPYPQINRSAGDPPEDGDPPPEDGDFSIDGPQRVRFGEGQSDPSINTDAGEGYISGVISDEGNPWIDGEASATKAVGKIGRARRDDDPLPDTGITAGTHGENNPEYSGELWLSLRGQPVSAAGFLLRAKPIAGNDERSTPTDHFTAPLVGLFEPAFKTAAGDSSKSPVLNYKGIPVSSNAPVDSLHGYIPSTADGVIMFLPPEYRREHATINGKTPPLRNSTSTLLVHSKNKFAIGKASDHYDGVAEGWELEIDESSKQIDWVPRDADRAKANYVMKVDGRLCLRNGTSVNDFSTDGTLAGDSDDSIPTEKAVKTYVDANAGGSSPWGRAGTTISPTVSGDDVEIDGVMALGDASINAVRTLNILQNTPADASTYESFYVAQAIPNGGTGDNNVFSLNQSLAGTSNRTNTRGFAIQSVNNSTAGTLTNLFGSEIVINNSSTGGITYMYGHNVRLQSSGGGTVNVKTGVRASIENGGETSIGLEGLINGSSHLYSYGVMGQAASGTTVTGIHAGLYGADNINHINGRSMACMLVGDLAWSASQFAIPTVRLEADTAAAELSLNSAYGTPVDLNVSGESRAATFVENSEDLEDKYLQKDRTVDEYTDASSPVAADGVYGQQNDINIDTGSSDVTITLAEPTAATRGCTGKVTITDTNGANVYLQAGSGDTMVINGVEVSSSDQVNVGVAGTVIRFESLGDGIRNLVTIDFPEIEVTATGNFTALPGFRYKINVASNGGNASTTATLTAVADNPADLPMDIEVIAYAGSFVTFEVARGSTDSFYEAGQPASTANLVLYDSASGTAGGQIKFEPKALGWLQCCYWLPV